MLIQQKMEQMHFTNNEKIIMNYILEKKQKIQNMTVKELAKETFTSPASLVFFAKKMGYSGWNDFKKDYIAEINYLESHFSNIDVNEPFTAQDNIMKIAHKIATLQNETIQETLALLHHDSLQKAVRLIQDCEGLDVYGTSLSYMAAQEFVYSMKRLGKRVDYSHIQAEQMYQANICSQKNCALIISYTGETSHVLQICHILQQRHIPIISITSIGENSINQYSQVVLHLASHENVYSKINSFSSRQSIHTLLDILYSCYFATNYDKHYQFVIEMNKEIETPRRFSSNKDINK